MARIDSGASTVARESQIALDQQRRLAGAARARTMKMFVGRVRGRERGDRSFRIYLTFGSTEQAMEAYFTGEFHVCGTRHELAVFARFVAVLRITRASRIGTARKRCKRLPPFVDQGRQREPVLFHVRLEPGLDRHQRRRRTHPSAECARRLRRRLGHRWRCS